MGTTRSKSKSTPAVDRPTASTLEEAQELGFIGTKVDPLPNSAHSQESGPDAPGLVEARAALHAADAGTPADAITPEGDDTE